MGKNYEKNRRIAISTQKNQLNEKINRRRTRSTFRNFFGRLTRSSSQEIQNISSHYEPRTFNQNKNNILK